MTEKPEAAKVQPPSGMQQSDTDLDKYEKWNFKVKPVLSGVVDKIKREITVQTKQGPRETDLMVVTTSDGPFLLWKNANLEQFFDDVQVGAEIWVQFDGMVELDEARTMKKFNAYYTNP